MLPLHHATCLRTMVATVEGLPITGSFSSVAIMTTPSNVDQYISAFRQAWNKNGIVVGNVGGFPLHLETVMTQVMHLATLRTFSQFYTAVMAFVSTVTHGGLGALINTALEKLRDFFTWDTETTIVQAGAWETQEWLRIGYGTLLAHWASLRNSSVVKHLQRLFTLCVCSGFADMEFAKKHPLFWKRALADIKVEEFDAFDIIGEILGTINVVWSGIRDCIVTKDITPLLGSGARVRSVELEMGQLDSLVGYYLAGTLERITSVTEAYPKMVTDAEFVTRVDKMAMELALLHKIELHPPTRIVLARYLQKALGFQAQVREKTSRGTIRMAPLTLKLDAPTCVGKSVLQPQLMRDTLRIAGYPAENENICYLDCSSKFWDPYTNATTGVIIDDAENTKPEYQKFDENSHLILLCNNAKTPVPKAKVEDKGGVFVEAKVVIISTNREDLNASTKSDEPSSRLRRPMFHIKVDVVDEFATSTDRSQLRMIDPTKLGPMGTPHHLFTVRRWVPNARTQERPKDTGSFKVVAGPFTYGEMLQWLKPHVLAHFDGQRKLMDMMSLDEGAELCEHGFTTAPYCHLCRAAAGVVDVAMQYSCNRGDPTLEELRDAHARALTPPDTGVQAGDFFDGIADFFVPPVVPPPAVIHGLHDCTENPCPVCHPAEAPRPVPPEPTETAPRPTLQDGWRQWVRVGWKKHWNEEWQPPAELPPEPRIVAFFKAFKQGRFDLETQFLRSPQLMLSFAYGVLPGTVGLTARLLFSVLGFGFFCTPMAVVSSFITAITVSRAVVTYVRCRVWGMTLTGLRDKMREVVTSGFSQLFLAAMAGICIAWTVSVAMTKPVVEGGSEVLVEEQWQRRVHELESSLEEAHAAVLAGSPPGPVGVEAGKPPAYVGRVGIYATPGGSWSYDQAMRWAGAAREAGDHIVAAQPVAETGTQGGCASLEVERTVPAQPDVKPREHMHERREVEIYRTLPGDIKTMTYEQSGERIDKQVWRMTITYSSGHVVSSNATIIATNYAIAPAHNFLRPDGTYSSIKLVMLARTLETKGPVCPVRIHPNSLYRLPGDLMLIQINTGGPMQDLTEFLPDKHCTSAVPIVEHYRGQNMVMSKLRYMANPARVVSHQYGWSYDGFRYIRPEPTFKGLCGALLIVPARWPLIVGMHTMGSEHVGEACPILREDVLEGMRVLRETGVVGAPNIVSTTSELTLPAGFESRGVIGELAAKSVLRTVPAGSPFMPVGTLLNVPAKHEKTRLARSPISALVEEVCGEPCLHGPPRNMGRTTEEIRKLQEYDGIMPLPPGPLRLAAQDMYDDLDALIEDSGTANLLAPLTEVEAVSGVVGCHSINAINLSTSAGFPRIGNKRGLVEDCPQPGAPEAKRLGPEMRAEVAQIKGMMAQLVKPNLVFTWCQKDEAVKLTKEKVRVFEGAPFALTFLFRQLFLPIFRVLYSELQPWTESAVGINATGPEWDGLARYLMQYDMRELFVADWIHYDTSLHYQEIMALFTIWIKLAIKWGCYTDMEICCMWVMAEVIACHLFIVKTDIAVVVGSNPSGNGGTVIVNNGCNGLRERSAFYALAPEEVPSVPVWLPVGETMSGRVVLRSSRGRLKPLLPQLHGRYSDYVRSIFYGDDLLCAVRTEIKPWFNQVTVSAWFQAQGKGMTGADKLPITQEFTRWEDSDFLKRKFRFDEETAHIMAPLALTSIYKALHVWPRQLPMAPEVHAADVLSGALRELFQHGREEYNARAPALLEVAERVGALPYMVTPSYDERVRAWVQGATDYHGSEEDA